GPLDARRRWPSVPRRRRLAGDLGEHGHEALLEGQQTLPGPLARVRVVAWRGGWAVNHSMTIDDPDDGAFVRFLADLEESADSEAVVRRYGEAYPHLADEFRAMVATRKVLALSVGPDVHDGPPQQLGDFRIVRE